VRNAIEIESSDEDEICSEGEENRQRRNKMNGPTFI